MTLSGCLRLSHLLRWWGSHSLETLGIVVLDCRFDSILREHYDVSIVDDPQIMLLT